MSDNKYQVWSCGGGMQSCAIGAAIVKGMLGKPDFSVISDTGREMPTTWTYFESILKPSLEAVGVNIVRIKADEWSYYRTGYVDGSGDIMLPCYTMKNGEAGKNKPDCSGAWKRDAINRWLSKTHGITRSNYIKWVGFSRDETRRILKMQKNKKEAGKVRFPLLELGLNRQECVKLVESVGWPKPPRSRCWMCPNQSDMEWFEVKSEHPEFFQSAIELDWEIQKLFPNHFLHSSVGPLKDADINPKEDLFSAGCPGGECFL